MDYAVTHWAKQAGFWWMSALCWPFSHNNNFFHYGIDGKQRSQACNTLQTDHSLYLPSRYLNQGMEAKHIMGLYCARRTVNTIAKSLSENHCISFKHFIQDLIENKWLLVLITDDVTSIYTKRRQLGDKASEGKSMCTIVVKAFKNIPAVIALQASIINDVNDISINTCLQMWKKDSPNAYKCEKRIAPIIKRIALNVKQFKVFVQIWDRHDWLTWSWLFGSVRKKKQFG